MLKKQGLVNEDPVYVDKLIVNVAPRERNTSFEDEEKSKQLARLLKSKNPHDLELANRLIKNMVKQDEIKTEKISTRINELEQINNNIKLLSEMLHEYDKHKVTTSEKETIKVRLTSQLSSKQNRPFYNELLVKTLLYLNFE